MSEYLNQLNEQQKNAVMYTDGPSLVIAGAGSGKTRVLTYKIVHLLHSGFLPHTILALTFTNKAANEMRERITQLLGDADASKIWMGTFHSVFAKILRINAERLGFKSNFTIYDTTDSKSLIKQIVKDMKLDIKDYDAGTMQSHFSSLKNKLISPEQYLANPDYAKIDQKMNRPMTGVIFKTYCERCKVSDAMDFDDLLYYTNVLLRDNPDVLERYQDYFKYILVDEYQDTNFAQHLIVQKLAQKSQRLCVVGDDAQSIYSFRGANLANILNLQHSYPTLRTFKLEQNYRSTQNIINAANSLIAKNTEQIPKQIFSENAVGSKIRVIQSQSDYEEGYTAASLIVTLKSQQGGSFEDTAILYRTNAQSRVLEEALRNRNIPYRIYGGLSFYQRKEIKDAVCYFRAIVNPNDDEAIRRTINTPARGIGETTIGKISHCAIDNSVSMWDVICNPKEYDLPVNSGTLNKLAVYKSLIDSLIEKNSQAADASVISECVIYDTGLFAAVSQDFTPENISRRENLLELVNGAKDFVEQQRNVGEGTDLATFLTKVSLATDLEETNDSNDKCVTLMTIHAAKGLEFRNVIIVGVEEDLFPSAMSLDRKYAIEEERRLMYVAITRAQENCIITYSSSRYRNGETKSCTPSRFISEIDLDYLNLSQVSLKIKKTYSSGDNRSVFSSSRFSATKQPQKPEYRHQFESRVIDKIPKSNITPNPTPVKVTVIKSSQSSSAMSVPDNFTIHSGDELSIGMKIRHSRFGEGVIQMIDTTTDDTKILVKFFNVGEKNLLLRFAKFEIL